MQIRILLLVFFFCGLSFNSLSQLTVNTTQTPTQLVQNVLLGTGVQVSNISYTGANQAKGSFNCNGCGLGFTDGVLLTSGSVFVAPGPNGGTGAGASNNLGGDVDLAALVSPYPSQDASVLEFDFAVASDSVEFRYIFASDEYNDYVNSNFNDVFAFFISGPGFAGQQNIALIPGTTTPVSINNVNNGNAPAGATATGPCTNCAYYVDNANTATATVNVEYDGLTTILTAKAAVSPCETYHIKLAISDVQDHIFDSGVFLEANSFTSFGQVSIIPDTTLFNGVVSNDTVYICPGETAYLCSPPAQNISWSTGDTTQCISTNQPGNYSMFIYLGTCFAWSNTITVVIDTPQAVINPNTTTIIAGSQDTLCANLGMAYLWSNSETTQCIIVDTAKVYTVTVTNFTGCTSTATAEVFLCGGGGGVASINLTGNTQLCQNDSALITANTVNFSALGYLWSTGDTVQSITVSASGTYSVIIDAPCGTSLTDSVTVTVNNPAVSVSGNLVVCPGINTTLTANSTSANSYNWSNGNSTSTINVSVGTYTVTITDAAGCTVSTSAQVTATSSPAPAISGVTSICTGFNTNFDAGAGYTAYNWSNGSSTQNITVSTGGTYTVTVTDANGCTGSDNIALTVNPNLMPTVTGPSGICMGDVASIDAGTGYATYLWSNGSTNQTISSSVTSSYTVTVTDVNGCSGTGQFSLNVNALPAPAISGNTIICTNASTTLDAGSGYSSYLWSNGNTGNLVSTSVANTYTVTVTDANGCSNTASAAVNVLPNPSPSITGVPTICSGFTSVLDAGTGYSSYSWSTGAGSQSLNATNSGVYTVTVTDASGCTGTNDFSLTVNPNPIPLILGQTDICVGDVATLNSNTAFSSYVWSNGASTNVINTSVAGLYTLTVTDPNGCTGSDQLSLTVHALPTPSITGANVLCDGNSSVFDAGGGYSTYLWNTGASTQIINVNVAGTYTVTVSDNIGCENETDRALAVNQNPVPVITGVNAFCDGSSSMLDAGVGYTSYNWNGGASSQSLSVSSTGNYTVTVTDANGCTGSASMGVNVHSLPTPNIVGPTDICDGDVATLDAGNTYISYNWSSGQNSSSINVSNTSNYIVTVTDNNGCTGSTQQQLTSHSLPTPVITGLNLICDGSSTNLDAGNGFAQYLWSNGNSAQVQSISNSQTFVVTVTDNFGCEGTSPPHDVLVDVPIANINPLGPLDFCDDEDVTLVANNGVSYLWSDGSTAAQITVNSTNSYVVSVTDTAGCVAVSAPISVEAHMTPIVNLANEPYNLCDQLSVSFINNSVYPPGSSILWNFGDGSTGSNVNPIHTYQNAGIYNVTLTIRSQYGCEDTDSIEVTVDVVPYPEAYFEMSTDMASIFNSKIEFTDLSLNAVSWHWTFGDNVTSPVQNPVHYYDHEGMQTVRLIVENSAGCVDEFSREVFITPYYIPNAFTPNGDGLNDYFFVGGYVYDVRSFNMTIWNRWGDLIYETNSNRKPWNGKGFNGFDATQGVYVYMIEVVTVNGVQHLFKGNVTLIR
ncbi:MAG: choice-of-anchor L domain-containing protein [Bacteroidia bacterium]|nr:choice-of-anchor L domain-containing protein [Bacteroidia bacterium]